MAAGYGLLVVVAVRSGIYPWLGLVVGALLITLGVAARQVISSRENYSLVITDSLTGLANRRQLRTTLAESFERGRRSGAPVAVLLLDLDGFKQVNDTYGHDVGDQMLVGFADVLRQAVRDTGVPARLGGDEFAVVMPAVSDPGEVTRVAERVLAGCREPLTLSGHTVRVRASIGIAVCDPRTGDADELMHQADMAMYAAKRSTTKDWVLASA